MKIHFKFIPNENGESIAELIFYSDSYVRGFFVDTDTGEITEIYPEGFADLEIPED